MLLGQRGSELNHFFRVVDGNDFFGISSHQLRECSLASAEIRYDHRWQKPEQGVGKRFPRTARNIGSAEATSEFVEIIRCAILAFFQCK